MNNLPPNHLGDTTKIGDIEFHSGDFGLPMFLLQIIEFILTTTECYDLGNTLR